MLNMNIPEQRSSLLAVTARLGVLLLVHVLAGVTFVLLVLKREVDVWGLETTGEIGLGSPVAADLLVWAVVPTVPLAAFEAWTAVANRLRLVGIFAALLATATQTWVGMLPVSLRFSGMRDPVTRTEVSQALGSCAALLLIHVGALVLPTLMWRLRSQHRTRLAAMAGSSVHAARH